MNVKIVTEPSVRLLSYPMFVSYPDKPLQDGLVPSSGAAKLIATAGKVCYDSFGSKGRPVQEHVEHLIREGHGSVLEHANFSLLIGGISRACSHEIVRHRAGFAYSQRSTRYTSEEGGAIVLEPRYATVWKEMHEPGVGEWKFSPMNQEQKMVLDFINSCTLAFRQYERQVRLLKEIAEESGIENPRKWARGKARNVLPHALETEMVMTGNLRAWRHFLTERGAPAAEAEIRRLAVKVYEELKYFAPEAFFDFEQGVDGYSLTVANRKV